ncbi:hypothetical protein DsansV1_C25g0187041 [Dioscorea sansibarensis]
MLKLCSLNWNWIRRVICLSGLEEDVVGKFVIELYVENDNLDQAQNMFD